AHDEGQERDHARGRPQGLRRGRHARDRSAGRRSLPALLRRHARLPAGGRAGSDLVAVRARGGAAALRRHGPRSRWSRQHHRRARIRRLSVIKFELICFDLDGTLVDSTADIRAALVHALAAVPPSDVRLDEHALSCAGLGLPLDEFYALARPAPHPQAGDGGRRRFIDTYRDYYHAHLLDKTRPFDGVAATLELVKPLRARGLRTAVATTKRTLTAERVLGGLGLAHHFDLILGTEAPMPHKPAPDLLLACAQRLDRDPRRGLMVG